MQIGGKVGRKATFATTSTVHVALWCVVHECALLGEPNWFPMKNDDQDWIVDLAYVRCPVGDERSSNGADHECRNDTDKWLQVFCVEE